MSNLTLALALLLPALASAQVGGTTSSGDEPARLMLERHRSSGEVMPEHAYSETCKIHEGQVEYSRYDASGTHSSSAEIELPAEVRSLVQIAIEAGVDESEGMVDGPTVVYNAVNDSGHSVVLYGDYSSGLIRKNKSPAAVELQGIIDRLCALAPFTAR